MVVVPIEEEDVDRFAVEGPGACEPAEARSDDDDAVPLRGRADLPSPQPSL